MVDQTDGSETYLLQNLCALGIGFSLMAIGQ